MEDITFLERMKLVWKTPVRNRVLFILIIGTGLNILTLFKSPNKIFLDFVFLEVVLLFICSLVYISAMYPTMVGLEHDEEELKKLRDKSNKS